MVLLSTSAMRAVLDGSGSDGRPYSWLVYAIISALQVLYVVSMDESHGPRRGLAPVLRPLNGSGRGEDWLSFGKLVFRGIWVPDVIDEEAARYQWSFNSFSRHVEGA